MEKLLKPGSIILLHLILFVGLLLIKIESLAPDANSVRDLITHIHIDIITHIRTDITTLTTIPTGLIGGNRVQTFAYSSSPDGISIVNQTI